MTTVSIVDHIKPDASLSDSMIDGFAKKTVLSLLKRLNTGALLISDQEQHYLFGDENMPSARIDVHHPSAYRGFLLNGSLGAGEAYMLGAWSSPDLLEVTRFFCKNLSRLQKIDGSRPWLKRLSSTAFHWLNANTLKGSKKNISAHYDLGNDFFSLFLDKRMMYSSAVYPVGNLAETEEDLNIAASYKLKLLCDKLRLSEDDHLVEIGTGWGGLALYAAENYGCKVTTTTISQEQYDYAKQAVENAGLQDKITLLLQDYRELNGQYSKLVSCEMIEAVGLEHYKAYFQKCSSLIKDDGLMCIQAITVADQRYEQAKNTVDFIKRYIFPGGSLPSNEIILKHLRQDTDMQMVDFQDIGLDYARTLNQWRARFFEKLSLVKQQGFEDSFIRMWEYYLCYCEGGFVERVISTAHFVFAKPQARQIKSLSAL